MYFRHALALSAMCAVSISSLAGDHPVRGYHGASAQPPRYHVDDLGDAIEAYHVNNFGVVACVDSNDSSNKPCTWDAGVLTELQTPSGWGGTEGINDAGRVVGSVGISTIDAAVWTPDGTLTNLGAAMGLVFSVATGVNSRGDCTVDSLQSPPGHAFVLRDCQPANATDIGTAETVGINSKRQVAGNATFGRRLHAFRWQQGEMTDLGVLEGDISSRARSINNHGTVVGDSTNSRRHRHAFVSNGNHMHAVGTLGGAQSSAIAINDNDVVVGAAQTETGAEHAFVVDLRDQDHKLLDLQELVDGSGAGWTFNWAVDINSAGQILVMGSRSGEFTFHAALLTPIP